MPQKWCRDCSKCVEIGALTASKKTANAMLIASTAGMSVVGSKVIGAFRKKCPQCGHLLKEHQLVEGRFKD